MLYTEKLQQIISKHKSNLIIGLDPDLKKLPEFFLRYENPVLEFNKVIIENTKDISAGYKPNLAFYELLGESGLKALQNTVSIIPDELIKICDAKRSDMGNTAEYYAMTYFDKYNFDSITLSPYMGEDSIEPFIRREDKGVYVLALTSNPGGNDFQKLEIGGKFLYEIVLEKSLSWNKKNNIGFVFGANHCSEIGKFTNEHKEIPLLIPGIGAQNNELENLMDNLYSSNFLINSSRGIIYSSKKNCSEKEFTESVRDNAKQLNSGINNLKKPA